MIENDNLYFLEGKGEMAGLFRKKDWAATPEGPPQNWPQSLRTTLDNLLNSLFPMLLFWGDAPMIDQVMTGGEPVWSENQLLPIFRNGHIEDVDWTFCYSPVRDGSETLPVSWSSALRLPMP